MRTTIAIDDELLRQAAHYTGIKEKAALVREALTRLVRAEAARRLAALGGGDPKAEAAPRLRSSSYGNEIFGFLARKGRMAGEIENSIPASDWNLPE
jgi:Arc/MetJ family transcription regulator